MGFLHPICQSFLVRHQTNGWKSFWYLLPRFSGPRDQDILTAFTTGSRHSLLQRSCRLGRCVGELGAFFLILMWTTLCAASILRRRWADDEHLAFPVIAVPLELTREGAPLLQNKLLWFGFAVPCFLHSLNSLHYLFPTLPFMPINQVKDFVLDAKLQSPCLVRERYSICSILQAWVSDI